ncbi:beta-lactamase family protein [Streptomyces roseirectus]|uniref:Beta-lactamase family protein n=1 Tax=Streptomyces roseirectus TaxID=2768066 RepID=A0A7H0IH24_9ACTN|nr:serine hydrolase domain-containing protein [Streptomyces roseirectus]QNP72090.1 beta-lactamase family protein [Streptomyces roseirectus]
MGTPTCLLGGAGISERISHGHDAGRYVEIGSLTKVFTATVLAELVKEGTVGLDAPLEDCIGSVPRGTGITLRNLAEHTSGLPRLPVVPVAPPNDPYATFTPAALADALGALDRQITGRQGETEYSNYGYAVLGHALTTATGRTYQQLVDTYVLAPLGVETGAVTAHPPAGERLVPRGLFGRARPLWDLTGPILPAGGLWSTCRTLADVVVALLVERRLGEPALAWQRGPSVVWHNGATRGSSVVAAVHDDGPWLVLHRLGEPDETDRLAIQTLKAALPAM